MSDESTGKVRLKIEPEGWQRISGSRDPPAELRRRAIDSLRIRHDIGEDEAAQIEGDAVFQQSSSSEYAAAKRSFDRGRKVPSDVTLRFSRPRDKREEKDEAQVPAAQKPAK